MWVSRGSDGSQVWYNSYTPEKDTMIPPSMPMRKPDLWDSETKENSKYSLLCQEVIEFDTSAIMEIVNAKVMVVHKVEESTKPEVEGRGSRGITKMG